MQEYRKKNKFFPQFMGKATDEKSHTIDVIGPDNSLGYLAKLHYI
jgi:hypothetical protein